MFPYVHIKGGRRVQTALLWRQGDQSVSTIDFAIQMVKDMDLPYSFVVRSPLTGLNVIDASKY